MMSIRVITLDRADVASIYFCSACDINSVDGRVIGKPADILIDVEHAQGIGYTTLQLKLCSMHSAVLFDALCIGSKS